MAVTKYVAPFDYSDAELLALFRHCLARISVAGQEYEMSIPGGGTRRYTAADLAEVAGLVEKYEAKIAAVGARGAAESLVSLRKRGA